MMKFRIIGLTYSLVGLIRYAKRVSFDEATEILKLCGFSEKYMLTDNGYIGVPL